jgi:RNA recognition motif-containing protein
MLEAQRTPHPHETDIPMKLWIGNLPPGKSDEDVRAFVRKYSEAEISSMTRIAGDGTRPGVLIGIEGASHSMFTIMQRRLKGISWDQHELTVQIMSFADQG